MKRIKKMEPERRNIFTVYGYSILIDNEHYVFYAKNMANACELVAGRLIKSTNIYEIEGNYVKSYDIEKGIQHKMPFWYYGRFYKL